MSVYASAETLAEVMALLCPVNGKTPREINLALPLTGRGTVYSALYLLVKSGRARAEGEMGRRRYRLALPG
jgi:hypothetical protein